MLSDGVVGMRQLLTPTKVRILQKAGVDINASEPLEQSNRTPTSFAILSSTGVSVRTVAAENMVFITPRIRR